MPLLGGGYNSPLDRSHALTILVIPNHRPSTVFNIILPNLITLFLKQNDSNGPLTSFAKCTLLFLFCLLVMGLLKIRNAYVASRS
mmetsp:Transcript_8530/g.16328  ORF Transcript_8530/g.16328 Transcript_8530/m.16328 type:complete len:85 (+) Transcript_8530:1581-1835(+)